MKYLIYTYMLHHNIIIKNYTTKKILFVSAILPIAFDLKYAIF